MHPGAIAPAGRGQNHFGKHAPPLVRQSEVRSELEHFCGGSNPAEEINPQMAAAMAEKGIDTAFQTPQSIEAALQEGTPDLIVTMGCGEACPVVPGAKHQSWDLPDPAGKPADFMREVRDDIEKKVAELVGTL